MFRINSWAAEVSPSEDYMTPAEPQRKPHHIPFRRRILFFAFFSLSLLVQSCAQGSPQATMLPPPALPPPWTPTISPAPSTLRPTPSATPKPSPTPACDLTTTLRAVKASIPYDEYAVHFMDLQGIASLGVWYVDPELEPRPSATQLQQQLQGARLRAAELAATVNSSSACSSRLFDVINPIVVDTRYQGWFSAQIRPADLPASPYFTEEDIARASDRFQPGYLRTALSHPYQPGTCEWPEALERLYSHFAADRELVAFYFVIDDSGSHVWAQWDGEADPIMGAVNIANISLALECFSPAAELIYLIVNPEGSVLDLGRLPPRSPP